MEDMAYNMMRQTNFSSVQDWLPAIVSIKIQDFGNTYSTEKGFNYGTVFPALNKPFEAGGHRYE